MYIYILSFKKTMREFFFIVFFYLPTRSGKREKNVSGKRKKNSPRGDQGKKTLKKLSTGWPGQKKR